MSEIKKVRMGYVGELQKKVVSDDELDLLLSQASGYEGKMKVYKNYWFSNDFINKNYKSLNWGLLCTYQPLNSNMIDTYRHSVDWTQLVMNQKLSQKTILQFRDRIDIDDLVKYQVLTEKFIEKYRYNLEMAWSNICFYQPLSIKFLMKHKDIVVDFMDDLKGNHRSSEAVDNFRIFLAMGAV